MQVLVRFININICIMNIDCEVDLDLKSAALDLGGFDYITDHLYT